MRFWIVNVFVRAGGDGRVPPSAGNPLAVVECAPGALTTAQMQAIAFEFGFSETTFVAPAPDGDAWPTRIFTPLAEMPFAGHPTLGTAHVVRSQLEGEGAGRTVLRLQVGDVPVADDAQGRLWLTAPPIRRNDEPDPVEVARAWGLDPALLDPDFPVVSYDAGPTPTVVPLRSVDALATLKPPASGPGSLYVLARDEATSALRVRLFAPGHGVAEDPATGSAACCLGRYLLDFDYLDRGSRVECEVHQGQEMGRPSLLALRASRTAQGDHIEVGGDIAAFAQGELA